jgi:hypothetical protein
VGLFDYASRKLATIRRVGIGTALRHKLHQAWCPLVRLFGLQAVDDRLFVLQERLQGFPHEIERASKLLGYVPDLKNPQSFNEKLLWKKCHVRDPLLPIIGDKIRVRDYVRAVLGDAEADRLLVPILYSTNRPETIPFGDLPEEYIIKSNHGSGTNLIIRKDSPIDREEIIRTCQGWLRQPYGLRKHEWHYQRIPRRILIEPLVPSTVGEIPADYKLLFFDGTFRLLQIHQGRFGDYTMTLFDQVLRRLDVRWKIRPSCEPISLDGVSKMIEIGERLSKPFDFIRVDFYWTGERVYFGELTAFPASGTSPIDPREFDFELGSYWSLNRRGGFGPDRLAMLSSSRTRKMEAG